MTPNAIKKFKNCSEEDGDPNNVLLVAKLESPTISFGIRKKMNVIKNKLKIIQRVFNII